VACGAVVLAWSDGGGALRNAVRAGAAGGAETIWRTSAGAGAVATAVAVPRTRAEPLTPAGADCGPSRMARVTGSSPVEIGIPTIAPDPFPGGCDGSALTGTVGPDVRPGTGGRASRATGIGPGPLICAPTSAAAVVAAGDNRTLVRRSAAPAGSGEPSSRRSAGPPRAGSGPAAVNASSARVDDRRGTASCATVRRTSRGAGGRARTNSTIAAPLTSPRTRPSARKLNSLAVTPSASRGACSFDVAAPWRGQRSCEPSVRQLGTNASRARGSPSVVHVQRGGW
jgi:hypothetical protein